MTGGKKPKTKAVVVSYLYLSWLNLTMLSTAAMMKNMRIGSNKMYWEMVMQPVSGRIAKLINLLISLLPNETYVRVPSKDIEYVGVSSVTHQI